MVERTEKYLKNKMSPRHVKMSGRHVALSETIFCIFFQAKCPRDMSRCLGDMLRCLGDILAWFSAKVSERHVKISWDFCPARCLGDMLRCLGDILAFFQARCLRGMFRLLIADTSALLSEKHVKMSGRHFFPQDCERHVQMSGGHLGLFFRQNVCEKC